jgi:SAM-dependent methyltransferase
MLQQTCEYLGLSDHRLRFAVLDAQAIPFVAGSFGGVIANHMLHHVDTERALGEIRRVLRPDGRLYCSTVGMGHMRELGELLRRFDSASDRQTRRATESFNLENGRAQISRWFSTVDLHRYEDSLVITEAEPLVAYVASSRSLSGYVREHLGEFARLVEQELASHGTIHIGKNSGMFEASGVVQLSL